MHSQTPDVSEQSRIIQDLFQRSKNSPNTEASLISAKWFNQWKDNPIDNKCLHTENQPQDDLKLHEDYEVVPDSAFIALKEWYGGGL